MIHLADEGGRFPVEVINLPMAAESTPRASWPVVMGPISVRAGWRRSGRSPGRAGRG